MNVGEWLIRAAVAATLSSSWLATWPWLGDRPGPRRRKEQKNALSQEEHATATVVVLAGMGLSGCATTEYVDEQIAMVNTRIDGVDAKATDAGRRADAAMQAAQAAAADARTANQRLDQLTPRVDALEFAPIGQDATQLNGGMRSSAALLAFELRNPCDKVPIVAR